jgi:hypothetical protein
MRLDKPGNSLQLAQLKLLNGNDMSRFPSLIRSPCAVAGWFGTIVLGGLVVQLFSAGAASITNATNNQSGSPDRTNDGAQIECVTPDGRVSQVVNSGVSNPGAPALMMDDETISCALPEGQTTFIIPIFKAALLDRFTFVNRNAAACGEFDISVSNSHLRADSPNWTQVNGIVPFAHKRLFNLSMLGVEAKYMKLSFHVEKASQRTGLGLYRDEKEPVDVIAKIATLPASAESPDGKIAILIASVF